MGHADSSAYPDQPQPGQPGPAQPGPAQPGSAQPGPAQPASGEAAPPTPGPRYFPDLPPAIDLPAMEHDVLARWQDG
jgi:hypothetical protein